MIALTVEALLGLTPTEKETSKSDTKVVESPGRWNRATEIWPNITPKPLPESGNPRVGVIGSVFRYQALGHV